MTDYKKHPKADEREDAAQVAMQKAWKVASEAVAKLLLGVAAQHNCYMSKCTINLSLTIDHVPGMEDGGGNSGTPAPCEAPQAKEQHA